MTTATLSSIQTMREATAPQQFTAQYLPLEQVTRPNLTTAEAASYLNRAPQTLRAWACLENFPAGLRCRRIGGRLAWPVSELRRVLLGVQA